MEEVSDMPAAPRASVTPAKTVSGDGATVAASTSNTTTTTTTTANDDTTKNGEDDKDEGKVEEHVAPKRLVQLAQELLPGDTNTCKYHSLVPARSEGERV
eukprot:TRINITY_DN263_c0_g1_i1.p1 TRINITY_DN263_c0_g1~~TRINITY_DN263_c0_g1_i1.p1  ORF type:complete len:100 (-),score=25.74 TRINITY_DN263_c0_g1_i1:287-586(-)